MIIPFVYIHLDNIMPVTIGRAQFYFERKQIKQQKSFKQGVVFYFFGVILITRSTFGYRLELIDL
tara:strand:- start:845 stop:1039 length:195 start_codon:yes stop_codon:yes gene_type:complete